MAVIYRYNRIHSQLHTLRSRGIITSSPMVYSPAGKKLWSFKFVGGDRIFTTAEVEVFILGAYAAMRAARMREEEEYTYDDDSPY